MGSFWLVSDQDMSGEGLINPSVVFLWEVPDVA